MKKIIYNTFSILGSLILHYAAFAENITFFQIVLYVICSFSLIGVIFSTEVGDTAAKRYADVSLLGWCGILALIAANLYIAHHNKAYFYFYILTNITLYGNILCRIFNDDKNNNQK